MSAVEHLPLGDGTAQWDAWGTTVRIIVTDPSTLDEAQAAVRAELDSVDRACSRFRDDAELQHAYRAAGRPVEVSELLAELTAAALRAARDTGGDVDPTVGAAMSGLGYDRDFATLATGGPAALSIRASASSRDRADGGGDTRLIVYPTADWRHVRLNGRRLALPPGLRLDFGATAKAWTADRCARLLADRYNTGALVSLGGDIATAGAPPDGGWRILVQDRPGEPACTVRLPGGGAIATSSTISRQWQSDAGSLHHILDPRTGMPAARVWRTVSVAARTCLHANTLSTAAVVRGKPGYGWLARQGAPARLVAQDGGVHTTAGWPA
jgi:thiamine biosynthesis lipoprotein